MGLPQITATGNLTSDPELRFTSSGKAVANWTVACNKKRKNEATNEWEDVATCFLRCSIWETKAEAVAEKLSRGDEVTVVGSLKQTEYTDKDGNKRTSYDVDAFSVALVVKAPRADRQQAAKPSQGDPWGAGGEDPWAKGPAGDQPPF
jgi:single-strand DNA-binding protein